MQVAESTPITRLEFLVGEDDPSFRLALYNAILKGECPDFIRSEGGDGSRYAAYWATRHVDAVRAWVRTRAYIQGLGLVWQTS